MRKRLSLLLLGLFALVATTMAQITVKGIVFSSEDNQPIIGASVKTVGSEVGAVTDIDGKFSITVPNTNTQLEVSYIGMTPKVVRAHDNLKVYLDADSKQIDEVLVVAYGKQKKDAFTGSAGVVGKEVLDKRVVSNVSNTLSGSVAGVQIFNSTGRPGDGATIRIRGIGSISSSNAPLIILDGVPYDGALSSINPADIASLTVLKDAASNAIYGARGANGVVLITTKNGNTEDAKITFDAKWGSNSRMVPQYNVIKDPGVYTQTQFKSLYNSVLGGNTTADQAYNYANSVLFDRNNGGLGYPIYTVPQGENVILRDFSLNPNARLGYSDGEFFYTPDNYYDEAFRNSFRQEYNASVSGKSNRLQYYAGVGYLDDNGITYNSFFKRYSARVNADYQAKKWLRIGTNVGYSYTDSKALSGQDSQNAEASAGNAFFLANAIAPVYPLYVRDASGNIMINQATGLPVYDSGTNTNFGRSNFAGNAIRDIRYNDSQLLRDILTSKFYAQITPIENLVLTASVSANLENTRRNVLFSGLASETGVDGSVGVTTTRNLGVNNQYLAQYSRSFGKNNFDILVGYEQYRLNMRAFEASNDHLFNQFIGELNNASNKPTNRPQSYQDEYMSEGILSRLQYDYDGKYFASASFRRDASSVFAKDHRWGNFGSVGAAWLITKENFMQPTASWLNNLKLKLSWGKQGNDALINPTTGTRQFYAYQDMYTTSYSDNEYALTMTYKGNPNLTWETSYSFNAGLEFGLLKNRISGSLEFFSRKTTDLIYNRPVPPSAGIALGSIPTNIGSIRNSGVELDLNGIILKGKDLEWSVNFNLTHNKNKILALSPELEAQGGQKTSRWIRRVGGSLSEGYLVRYAGVNPQNGESLYYVNPDAGNFKTTNNYNAAQRSDVGDLLPKAFGGFGTNLTFKGFDFSLMLAYQLGGRTYDSTYQMFMHTGSSTNVGYNWHKDILNAWSPDNTTSNIPRLNAADDITLYSSDRFLISSDYLSINNITLGYTLPKSLLNKIKLSACRVYVSSDNVALFSARKGLDPRYGYTALGNSGSTSDYPSMRTITAGIQVSF